MTISTKIAHFSISFNGSKSNSPVFFYFFCLCFQKRGNNRVRQLETASKETLYRVLVNHTNIIESQKAVLDTIEHEVKELKMRNIISKGKFRPDHHSAQRCVLLVSFPVDLLLP